MIRRLFPEKASRHELVQTFDRKAFFKYVEDSVLSATNKEGKFEEGVIEWFIVDYFYKQVFQGKDFVYVPEFGAAILELLQRHQDKLSEFARGDKKMRDAMLPDAQKIQYLTLAFPKPAYNPGRGLIRSMMDSEIYIRRQMNMPINRIRGGVRRIKRRGK